jgi:hypothetical protein
LTIDARQNAAILLLKIEDPGPDISRDAAPMRKPSSK